MAANLITLGRVILTFIILFLLQGDFYFRIAAVFLTVLVIYLDSLDGIVARKLGTTSDFGALFDIAGDRIVEHAFWIFFATTRMVSIWVPIIFISRSFLVDTLRTFAYSQEKKTPFGKNSMMKSRVTRFLTTSRASRGIYGVGKVLVFVFLGIRLVIEKMPTDFFFYWLSGNFVEGFVYTVAILVWLVVAMNLIRGLPVLWDGRMYLFDKYIMTEIKNAG